MTDKPPPDAPPGWADNSNGWPALATMLAPAAGCDCQVLALMIADQVDTARNTGLAERTAPARH